MGNSLHASGSMYASRKAREFTLLELIVVLMTIGMPVGYVGPRYFAQIGSRRPRRHAPRSMPSARRWIDCNWTAGMAQTPRRLAALVQRPSSEANWEGPWLSKALPPDPWGKPYVFTMPGEHDENGLLSCGKDGIPGGERESVDITNWQ